MKKLRLPLLIIVSLVLLFGMRMGFIFLLLALLPSVAAYFIDPDSSKPIFRIVASCNVAALLPIFGNAIRAAAHFQYINLGPILYDPMSWLFIYGGAAAGWALMYISRMIGFLIVAMQYQYHLMVLDGKQRKLKEEWGDRVAQNAEKSAT